MNIYPNLFGARAQAQIEKLGLVVRAVNPGIWGVSGNFAILCNDCSIYYGDQEAYSGADGPVPEWRLFNLRGGATWTLDLPNKAYVASTNPIIPSLASLTNLQFGPPTPSWLNNLRYGIFDLTAPSNPNNSSGSSFGGFAVLKTPQFVPMPDDAEFDNWYETTPATWQAFGGGTNIDIDDMGLSLYASPGDTNSGYIELQYPAVPLGDNINSLYLVIAVTKGLSLGANSTTDVALSDTGLLDYLLVGISPNCSAFSAGLSIPNLSPGGTISLPDGGDQLGVGLLAFGASGTFNSTGLANNTPGLWFTRRSQKLIGSANRTS